MIEESKPAITEKYKPMIGSHIKSNAGLTLSDIAERLNLEMWICSACLCDLLVDGAIMLYDGRFYPAGDQS